MTFEAFKQIINYIAILIIAGVIISYLIGLTPFGRDDSDSQKWGGGRSNMKILTDALTGCQYLSDGHGGLVPRLDINGKALLCKQP